MHSPPAFRVHVTLPLAVFSAEHGPTLPEPKRTPNYSTRLRSAVARLPLGDDPALREVIEVTSSAITQLEQTVAHLEHQLALARAGIELTPTPVTIGQEGLTVPEVPADAAVYVVALLNLRGMDHLLVTRGVCTPASNAHEIAFVDAEPAVRDLLVAYCFQQQGEERRRALHVASR